jgi:hypothetical protein
MMKPIIPLLLAVALLTGCGARQRLDSRYDPRTESLNGRYQVVTVHWYESGREAAQESDHRTGTMKIDTWTGDTWYLYTESGALPKWVPISLPGPKEE